jgi:hypothetical protein
MDQATANNTLEITESWRLPFSKEDLQRTPFAIKLMIASQQKTIEALNIRLEQLEKRLNLK